MGKKLIQEFYDSDAIVNREVMDRYLHPEVVVEWHSSKGFLALDRQKILELSDEMSRAYVSSRYKISHIISKNDQVAVRYSHYVKTVENPREEMLLAHFMVIWELRDGLLYRGFQMSQL
jgi:hypothetical protein